MNNESRNILIVTSEFPPQPGGIGNHAYNLAVSLSKEGFNVSVIADQRSDDGIEEKQFDTELPFQVTRIKKRNVRLIMYVKRILKTKAQLKRASHVIATGKFSLWNVAFLSWFKSINTLAVIHGTEVNFKSFFLRKSINLSLKRFDTIVAVSNYTKSLVSDLNKEVHVIPNGINNENWQKPQDTLTKLIGSPSLTTVGRVSPRKGQLNVIKLLPELIKTYPQLHYHCVGIATEADAIRSQAKALNVDSHITFHGVLSHEALQDVLNKTDIFVMLSSETNSGDVEGFGIAILEANALGVPAIGALGSGIEDAIKPNCNGELIEVSSAEQFKIAVSKILSHKEDYQTQAENWAKEHDWSYIIKHYIALLK
ncbi:glycosyltransferase family 4 protein [Psychroserpens sp. XS_ASV72]|uniref:glycosyltransferase family 4 protein n=1 Tax=Psychroserpens sp. XS_ASV72 TaxID=3241293 RepID=UPI00351731A3